MMRHFQSRTVFVVLVGSMFATALCRADFVYDVTVDTAPLNGNTNAAPYSLDFQLIPGGGPPTTATISDFAYGAGGLAGDISTQATAGQASGDIGGTVSLSDSLGGIDNELLQQFTPGDTLTFQLDLNGTLTSSVPDGFNFSILDNTYTSLPMLGGVSNPGQDFVSIDLATGGPIVQSFGTDDSTSPEGGGDPIDIAAPAVVAVPEPACVGILVMAGLGILSRRRR